MCWGWGDRCGQGSRSGEGEGGEREAPSDQEMVTEAEGRAGAGFTWMKKSAALEVGWLLM